MKIHTHLTRCAAAAAVLTAGIATAQGQDERGRDRAAENRRQQTDRDTDRTRNADRGQTMNRGRDMTRRQPTDGDRGTGRYRVTPTGVMRVAVDYDGDGRFDAIETVYAMEFQKAMENSGRNRGLDMKRSLRPRMVSGTIRDLDKVLITGGDHNHEHMIARVETERGTTARVDLGPTDQLMKLNLSDGRTVKVDGVRGRINDRSMLLATRVTSGDQSVKIERPRSRGLRRISGTVTGTYEKNFRGQSEPYLIGMVRTAGDRRVTVNMGPASKFENSGIEDGSEVQVLARPGRINDRPALVAEQVRAGETLIDVRGGQTDSRKTPQQGRRNEAVRRTN